MSLGGPISWHVSSRSGEAVLLTEGEPLYSVYILHLLNPWLAIPGVAGPLFVNLRSI